jgi:hypothetical protein
MRFANVFMTTTNIKYPTDASTGTEDKLAVSEFVTVQSFANYALITGAITAAWRALQMLMPELSTIWVPYGLAFLWAIISFVISIEGLKTNKNGQKKLKVGTGLQAIFIAFINSLVLASAVVGTNIATSPSP